MRYIDTFNIIRQLAKTSKFQTLYNSAKEIGLKLFKNDYDYSELQLIFLNYLNFYSIINLDIALGDIDDIVLDNKIYEEAYMYYKRKSRSDKKLDYKKSIVKNTDTKKINQKSTSTWIFKTKTPSKGVK